MSNLINPYRGGGGSCADSDANDFITATGISDPTIEGAICVFVIAVKAAGVWAKSYALYPIVGGTETTHKYNLKDPRDLDAAFRLLFSTGVTATWTHTSGGAFPDTANTLTDAETFFKPSTDLASDSYALTGTILDNTTNDGYLIGSFDVQKVLSRNALTGGFFDAANLINDGTGLAEGSTTVTSDDSDSLVYKNGNHLKTVSGGITPSINNAFICGGGKADLGGYVFAGIHQHLTATEIADLHSAIDTLNTSLSRKTW